MDTSQILWNGYKRFILNVYGKQIPTPYRINIPPDPHPRRQGKSSPQDILKQLKIDALEQGFSLKSASVDQIHQFMIQNKLGIDCSGFAYRMLDYLFLKLCGKRLKSAIGSHVGNTNVQKLTSMELSEKIEDVLMVRPGDLVKLNSHKPIPHLFVVLESVKGIIKYVHSGNGGTGTSQVQAGEFRVDSIQQDLPYYTFDQNTGDGFYRLKVLK